MEITPNKSFHYVVIKIIFVIYISDQLNLQVLVRYICLNNSCLILFGSAHKTPHYTIKRIYSFAYFILFILVLFYVLVMHLFYCIYMYYVFIIHFFVYLVYLLTYLFYLLLYVLLLFAWHRNTMNGDAVT